jgi:hypothetical protein
MKVYYKLLLFFCLLHSQASNFKLRAYKKTQIREYDYQRNWFLRFNKQMDKYFKNLSEKQTISHNKITSHNQTIASYTSYTTVQQWFTAQVL